MTVKHPLKNCLNLSIFDKFHWKHNGETPNQKYMVDSFDEGYFLGLLTGEGHFGGDGRKAQVTLRMHTRHEKLFYWLVEKFPGSKLYGPYHHGGRDYLQWMARGEVLKNEILPLIYRNWEVIDDHVQSRITEMCTRYKLSLEPNTEIEAEPQHKTNQESEQAQ